MTTDQHSVCIALAKYAMPPKRKVKNESSAALCKRVFATQLRLSPCIKHSRNLTIVDGIKHCHQLEMVFATAFSIKLNNKTIRFQPGSTLTPVNGLMNPIGRSNPDTDMQLDEDGYLSVIGGHNLFEGVYTVKYRGQHVDLTQLSVSEFVAGKRAFSGEWTFRFAFLFNNPLRK